MRRGMIVSFRAMVVLAAIARAGASLCGGEAELTIDSLPGLAVKQPFGVAVGPDGQLYVCSVEEHRIVRYDLATGKVTPVVGTGEIARSPGQGDGGPALRARLNEPYELRFDAKGQLYFVEMRGCVVRRVDREGVIHRVAGSGEPGFGGDGGPAVKAKLSSPHSIALDGRGGLYVADIGNHRIRRVDLSGGVIETIAGTGERALPVAGTVATGRAMLGPRALAISGKTLWIALREGHSVWSMDLETRRLRHVAGSGRKGFSDGVGKEASFNGPKGIVTDAAGGTLFVVDTENQTIRAVSAATGRVSTIAGVGPKARGFGGDGGPARRAKMDRPHGIAIDAKGRLYIGDTNNHRVRRIRAR